MKNEETDWIVYHIIAGRAGGWTKDELAGASGFDAGTIDASLSRLQGVLLITCRSGKFYACSIEEFIISSQIKHDPLLGLDIENGIIKVRK